MSQDPIGLEGNNPNLYAYVSDTNAWVDPFGLDCGVAKGGKGGAKGGAQLAKYSGILRDAAKYKGNFGLGKGTANEALELGKAWVGRGYKISSSGKAWISKDGLRQFRPPTHNGYTGAC